jgi:protein-S-isoprenylcysteine O-methyltransferase Ste14
MRPFVSGHPVQAALFGCTLAVWMVVEVRQALRRRPCASSAERGSLLVLRIFATIGILLAALAGARVPEAGISHEDVAFAASLSIMWSGVVLRFWSFSALGRYFTFTVMTSADQPVMTDGPYRLVRHPSYLGLLLILTGLGAAYGNWLSLAALAVIPTIGLIYRIHVEEAALSATLGRAYTSYASGHKRLIPLVW